MNSISGPQSAFDSGQHYLLQHHQQQPSPSSSSRSRKRAATGDQDLNPKLLAKRAKAAERQRRKRERDRRASAINEQQRLVGLVPPAPGPGSQRTGPAPAARDGHALEQHHEPPQPQIQQEQPQPSSPPPPPPPQSADASTQTIQPTVVPAYPIPPPPAPMPPQPQTEEDARKERVRAAARDRQRKHRALVKRKKLMELGVQMGDNGLMPEELTYTLGPDGNYTPTHPPNQEGSELADGHEIPGAENGFLPDGTTQSGGQTFASYILLAMSCSPLLKQHLLRQLHMTNEDLHSLEPVLCTAFDHWDQARREAFAAEQMKMQNGSDGPQEQPGDSVGSSHIPAPSTAETTVSSEASTDPNDFRTRFHRSLVAPSPFTVGSSSSEPSNGISGDTAEQEHAVAITTESIQQQLEQALPTSIDPRLSRLPPNITFAEIVAKMAAAAAGASLTVNPANVKHTMNGTGETDGLVDVDAVEGAEVEDELEEEELSN